MAGRLVNMFGVTITTCANDKTYRYLLWSGDTCSFPASRRVVGLFPLAQTTVVLNTHKTGPSSAMVEMVIENDTLVICTWERDLPRYRVYVHGDLDADFCIKDCVVARAEEGLLYRSTRCLSGPFPDRKEYTAGDSVVLFNIDAQNGGT